MSRSKENKLEPLGLGGVQESIPIKFSLSDLCSLSVQKIIGSRTRETKHRRVNAPRNTDQDYQKVEPVSGDPNCLCPLHSKAREASRRSVYCRQLCRGPGRNMGRLMFKVVCVGIKCFKISLAVFFIFLYCVCVCLSIQVTIYQNLG